MKQLMIKIVFLSFITLCSCSKSNNDPSEPLTSNNSNNNSSTGKLISVAGINAWDNLSQTEKDKLKSFNSLFLHQSVGGDLEDGSNTNGFPFYYYNYGDNISNHGLYGGLFQASNSNPLAKINEFKTQALLNKTSLKVAIFKFGYDDVSTSSINSIKTAYKAMVDELKQNGIKILHITPPLVFDTNYNQPKMDLRQWMINTFTTDVIFDLADIESTDPSGTKSQINGVWHLYSGYRSVSGCQSYAQGVDQPTQGHLCHSAADRISKGLLYAIYTAGK